MMVLRQGLLEGRAVALSGSRSVVLRDALVNLGARVEAMPALDGAEEERVGEWARSRAPLGALVHAVGPDTLEEVLDGAWIAVREVAVGALIPSGHGGKIVLVAPPLDPPAQAGLENLARTLSVEWARHRITTCAVIPGEEASDAELAEIVAFLVSQAGDYFSGCRLDVGRLAVG